MHQNDITNGVLHAEEKLPSKRMLDPKNLGISLITVENAYAQLVVEWLYLFAAQARLLRGAH